MVHEKLLKRSYGHGCCRSAFADAATLLVFAGLILFGIFFGQLISSGSGQLPLIISVAGAMFFLTVLRPDWALTLLIFAMLLSPEVKIGTVPGRDIVVRIEDLLIFVMGLAWIARSAIRKGIDIVPKTPINAWIGAYIVCFLVATSQGIISGEVNPLRATFYILKYLEYYIIFFMVVGLAYRKSQYRAYLIALFITFMIVNFYAVSQIGHVDRVSAPFEGAEGEPNTLGGYQVLMMCVAMGLFCHLRSKWVRWIMVGTAVFTLWPFMHTLSRASYMALVPAYLALIFYNRSSRRNVLIFSLFVATILGILFLPENVKERIMYTFTARPQANIDPAVLFGVQLDPSASARWWDWWKAIGYWFQKPFFGYGLTGRSFLDSQYINNLVETGMLGFVAFAGIIGTLHYQVLKVYRRSTDELVRGLSLGFLAGNVGMLFHAVTANTFILIRIMEPYWFMAAMILAAHRFTAGSPEIAAAVSADVRTSSVVPPLPGRRNVGFLLRDNPKQGGTDAT
jgi:O-antigen ligase